MTNVVVVESPAKAKTIINTWEVSTVLASYGHVRNLPKNGSIDVETLTPNGKLIKSKKHLDMH